MVWYNGNVGEAIGKANANKKLIVVYIHGEFISIFYIKYVVLSYKCVF